MAERRGRGRLTSLPEEFIRLPIVLQGADGRLQLVYTSEGRRVVNHAVFDESMMEAFRR
jgi:hypothetical protein